MDLCESEIKEKLYAATAAASESGNENAMQIKVHLIFISWNGIRLSLTTSGNLDERERAWTLCDQTTKRKKENQLCGDIETS